MTADAIRIDKWLWYARFCRGRAAAQRLVSEGRVRVNRLPVAKTSATVKPGDVLTFALGPHVRVVRVLEPGSRRGPASEARTLYEDLAPPRPAPDRPAAVPPC
jgi:ribosome-associated heat shock protein Hsp15